MANHFTASTSMSRTHNSTTQVHNQPCRHKKTNTSNSSCKQMWQLWLWFESQCDWCAMLSNITSNKCKLPASIPHWQITQTASKQSLNLPKLWRNLPFKHRNCLMHPLNFSCRFKALLLNFFTSSESWAFGVLNTSECPVQPPSPMPLLFPSSIFSLSFSVNTWRSLLPALFTQELLSADKTCCSDELISGENEGKWGKIRENEGKGNIIFPGGAWFSPRLKNFPF